MCIHALVLFIVRWQWCTKELCYIKLEIAMRKHAKHAHVNSFLTAQKRFLYALHYYIPNIKAEKMLCEPFMLNIIWKSTERFGNLSQEKYGLLKWKMCRKALIRSMKLADWRQVNKWIAISLNERSYGLNAYGIAELGWLNRHEAVY